MINDSPPSSSVACRRNCGVAPVMVSSIWVRSAEMRLASSPTRRWPKKDMGREISREYVSRRMATNARSPTSLNQMTWK